MFDLDALIANKDLILKDRDNRADVQKVLSVYAEKVDSDYVVKAKWSDIFDALLQGMKVQAQVVTLTEADEEEETDASAVIETYDLYDATVTANGFKVNGTDLSASSADAYPVGSLSRPSSGGGGGGSNVLVSTVIVEGEDDSQTLRLDHTWQEISDADAAIVRFMCPDEFYISGFVSAPSFDAAYTVISEDANFTALFEDVYGASFAFECDSADDYPAMDGGGK